MMVTVSLPHSNHSLPLPGHQMSPQSLSFHQAAPHVHCRCGGVATGAGDVVSEGRGVSAGREWSGMQPHASLLSQQRGKTLVFHFLPVQSRVKQLRFISAVLLYPRTKLVLS